MKNLFVTLLLCLPFLFLNAQQNVGIGTAAPNSNALLDVVSSTKGVLFPRLTTTERTTLGATLVTTDQGLLVFDNTIGSFHYWDGTAWKIMTTGDHIWNDSNPAGIYYDGGNVAIGLPFVAPSIKFYVNETGSTGSFNTAGYFRNWATGSGPRYGLFADANGPGSVYRYGGYFKAGGGDNGNRYGLFNEVDGGSLQSNPVYGIYNEVSLASTATSPAHAYGTYNKIVQSGTGATYGSYNDITGNGVGTKWGTYTKVTGSANQAGDVIGFHVDARAGSATNSATVYGVRASITPEGTGNHYALFATNPGMGPNNWSIFSNQGNSFFGQDVRLGHVDDVTGYVLSVKGDIICENVTTLPYGSWPDYVFEEDYDLMPLEEVQDHILAHKHLPGIPSAQEIEDAGVVHLNQMNEKLLEKIEELTLHVIQLNERVKELEANSDE